MEVYIDVVRAMNHICEKLFNYIEQYLLFPELTVI